MSAAMRSRMSSGISRAMKARTAGLDTATQQIEQRLRGLVAHAVSATGETHALGLVARLRCDCDEDEADRLFRAPAVGARDSGDGGADVGAGDASRPPCHRA